MEGKEGGDEVMDGKEGEYAGKGYERRNGYKHRLGSKDEQSPN